MKFSLMNNLFNKVRDSTKSIRPAGDKEWHNKRGQLHRNDDPAIERTNGDKEWWCDGKRHRVDGLAIERADGYKAWWVDGKELTTEQIAERQMVIATVAALRRHSIPIPMPIPF
jgi:hypothetical protein